MSTSRNTFYQSGPITSGMVDSSALSCVGYVHLLIGLVTLSIGIAAGGLFVYLGYLCVGIWTGSSFIICGALSIMAGRSSNMLTVIVMACTNIMTLNFACTGFAITFSSLFPGNGFYAPGKGGYPVVHNQTTGTALAILYLVVDFIEIVVCITGIRVSWKIFSNFGRTPDRRRADSYDEPFLSSNSYAGHESMGTRRGRCIENTTPPPDYDWATHNLTHSTTAVPMDSPRVGRYGSLTEADSSSLRGSF